MRPSTLLISFLLISLPATALHAQRVFERQAILSAVREFGDAADAADASRLTAAIWVDGSNAQRLARDLFVQLLVAEKRLERVAGARFGTAGGARFQGNLSEIYSAEDRSALPSSEVFYGGESGDVAWVKMPGETYPMRVRRNPRQRTQWQVVLEVLDRELEDDLTQDPPVPNARSQCRLEYYQAMMTAVNEVAGRIEKGEYASAAAAEADLFARLEQALDQFIVQRNALNISRRRGRPNRYYR